jgi:hypothetical protein
MGDDRRDLLDIAWADFIRWAMDQPEIVAQFNAATGRSYQTRAQTILGVMVDEATGKLADDTEAFMLWATETYWGTDEAPGKVRAALAAPEETGDG